MELVLYVVFSVVMFSSLASSWAVGVEGLPSACARALVDVYISILVYFAFSLKVVP